MKSIVVAVIGVAVLTGCGQEPEEPAASVDTSTTQTGSSTSASPASSTTTTQTAAPETLSLTAGESELCAYLTDNLVTFRDGEPGVATGFLDYATGGGGGLGLVEASGVVRMRFEASKAASDAAALGDAPQRLRNVLDFDTDSFVEPETAAEVGMGVVDVLARCQHHGGWQVSGDPDPLANTLIWVSNGADEQGREAELVKQMCTYLVDFSRLNITSLKTERDKAVLVSWLQAAALYECTDKLEESIRVADALL